MVGDGRRAGQYVCLNSKFANVGSDTLGIEAIVVAELRCVIDAAENDFIRCCQGLRQGFLKNLTAHGIRAWFENGPQTTARPTSARCGDGRAYGSGVVGEIIHDEYASEFAFDIKTALHAAKCFQRLLNCTDGNAAALRSDDCSERVQHVVLSGSREVKFAKRFASTENFKVHSV